MCDRSFDDLGDVEELHHAVEPDEDGWALELAAGLDGTAHDASIEGMEGLLTGAQALRFPGWNKANRVLASLKAQGIAVEPIGSH